MSTTSSGGEFLGRLAMRLGARPSRLLAGGGGILLFAMMLLTLFDVAGRYLFNSPLPAVSELVAYMMAGVVFGTLPHVCFTEQNITIDLMDGVVPTRLKRLQGTIVNVISAGTLAFISWRLVDKAISDFSYPETTPELSMTIWPFTAAIALLCIVATIAQSCVSVLYLTHARENLINTTSQDI